MDAFLSTPFRSLIVNVFVLSLFSLVPSSCKENYNTISDAYPNCENHIHRVKRQYQMIQTRIAILKGIILLPASIRLLKSSEATVVVINFTCGSGPLVKSTQYPPFAAATYNSFCKFHQIKQPVRQKLAGADANSKHSELVNQQENKIVPQFDSYKFYRYAFFPSNNTLNGITLTVQYINEIYAKNKSYI